MNYLHIIYAVIGGGFLLIVGYICGEIEESIRQEKCNEEAYMNGYADGKKEKQQAYIDLGPADTVLGMLIDDIKNNVFSAETREN